MTSQSRKLSARSTSATRLVAVSMFRSEEHTSELQSQSNLVCRLLLEKKKKARFSLPATSQSAPVLFISRDLFDSYSFCKYDSKLNAAYSIVVDYYLQILRASLKIYC